ncbi:ABC transporter, solute-binding protein [Peptostreptococcaceae bacterium oral taxon 113 str. W5053]|nr:ABC transporter, solute-binding protein [Peptostreptococcaceae bacterium oral taxon 113 str. W5053]
MKRNLRVLLALTLVLALALAACGGGNKPAQSGEKEASTEAKEEGVTLSVQAEEAWVEYYNGAIERVKEAYPNAQIKVKTVGSFDHLDTLDATDASNPDVADVFALPADRIYSLAAKEVLASLDSKAMSGRIGGWSDFDAGIGGNLKVGEDYLAFPFNIETLINFANKANAQANNIDLSKPLEIKDMKDPASILLPMFDAWYGVALTNAAGIELLGKDADGKLFSDLTKEWAKLEPEKQAVINAIYEYWKSNNEANTALFDNDAGWGYVDDTFRTGGKGVIRLGGPWDTNSISEQAGNGADMEIYPITQITVAGKPLIHWQGGWGLGINSRIEADAAKMEVAAKLIEEIVNPAHAVELFKATGKILENVPADVYVKSDLSETDKKVIAAVIESYQKAPKRPLFTEWGKVWDTWKNAVLSWNSVKPATVEDAYKELKASFDSMMANF